MSGQKRLNKVCNRNRVIAIPSRVVKDYAYDENGQIKRDPKTNVPLMKDVQLYNIYNLS